MSRVSCNMLHAEGQDFLWLCCATTFLPCFSMFMLLLSCFQFKHETLSEIIFYVFVSFSLPHVPFYSSWCVPLDVDPCLHAERTLRFHIPTLSPAPCIAVLQSSSIIYRMLWNKLSQTWWLKIATAIISQSLWVRIPGMTQLPAQLCGSLYRAAHNTAACSTRVKKL